MKTFNQFMFDIQEVVKPTVAETQEAAEAIMVNMSEDWRESILG